MDISLIAAASSAISAARDVGKAAVGLRDFNQLAGVIAQMNEQILKAQDSLFAHNAQLLALQNEVFEAREELRKARESLAERGKYALFELSPGVFVYRSRADLAPHLSGASNPGCAEPQHYVCQGCFDKGERIVLVRLETAAGFSHQCPQCKTSYPEETFCLPAGRVDYSPYA